MDDPLANKIPRRKNTTPTGDPSDPSRLVSPATSTAKIPADQVIFAQDDPCDVLYYLRSGIAKASILSETGQEAVVLILAPGDFFGESAMVANARRVGTVTAMTECTIERIEVAELKRRLFADPAFFQRFMEFMVTRSRRYLLDLTDHHFHSTERRLAHTLMRLAKSESSESKAALPRFSHQILAEMIGTTRPRISYFMNKFRRQGFIEYDRHGHIRVGDSLSKYLLED